MRAGILRHKIRIEERTEAQSSIGQITRTWSTVATVRASIEPLRGREFFEAQAITEQQTVRIKIRYRGSLDEDMRLVDVANSTVYEIQSIINMMRRNTDIEIIASITNDEST